MKTFAEKVYEYTSTIPQGEVRTYKQVAKALGSPKAYRAVASALAKNFDSAIPCHRVIRSDGKMGGYNRGGESVKRKILIKEGVIFNI
jgi:methylated-DNA-[protein]-cysteine S-methyltransferase